MLTAYQQVALILSEAETLADAGVKILQALAENGGWDAGEIWIADRRREMLRSLEIWHKPGMPLGEFETETRTLTFTRGVDLPGRVWAIGRPEWQNDLRRDNDFSRSKLAVKAGLRAVVGFPIAVDREIIGVVAFFRTAVGPPTESFISLLDEVGRLLGKFLLREWAEAEQKTLATAVRQTANSVVITDRNGVIEYANPAFEKMTGFSCDEVIGRTPRILKSGHHDQNYYTALWKTILAGKTFFAEFTNRKKGGELFRTEQSITPLRDAHGQITHIVATGSDVTERWRAREALRKSDERYRILFESSHDAIMTLEPPVWKFTSGNAATVKMFGTKNEAEFISLGPMELSPERQPDGRASADKAGAMIETALREGSHFFEWTHRRLNGEEFAADVLLTRIEQDGKVILQATVRDITERKRAADSLRK